MKLILLISGSIVGSIWGRLLTGRWFSYLSIYSVIWAGCLGLYELKLISYNPIIPEAWLLIVLGWVALYLGSATPISARLAITHLPKLKIPSKRTSVREKPNYYPNVRALQMTVLLLCAASALSIILQWISLINEFETIKGVINSAYQIYHLRLANKIWQGIPYIGSFALAACGFGGVYTAIRGRLTIIGVLPLIMTGFGGVATMGRAGILIGGVLFFASFMLFPHTKLSKAKVFVVLFFLALPILVSLTLISANRGLTTRFAHETPRMETLRSYISFAPSLYLYLSGPPVVFSEYLKEGGEDVYPGTTTFAPFFNALSRFGIGERSTYGNLYYTPETINVGTYLKDLHRDFGALGVLIFPYLLGVGCMLLHQKNRERPNVLSVMLLVHLYVVIVLSFDVAATKLGYWAVSLIVSVASSIIIDHKHRHFMLAVKSSIREESTVIGR